ncbi:hypothetical protein JCM5353_006901 [Sporobolomyces roseus]
MLSSLPPELLRQIIESTVPYTYHSDTYDSRQQTLCILSLVSRLFQQIAQPLLRRVVRLPKRDNRGSAERILCTASLQGWEEDVRQLIMYTEDDTDKSVITVDQVVLAFPRLAELAISRYTRPLKQSELYAISRLSGKLPRLPSDLNPVHLPGLETLTLSDAYGRNGDLKSFLQPSMLPSLQALALIFISQDQLLDLLCNPLSLLLLHQIEAFFVNANMFVNPDTVLRKMQPFLSKTLVHLNKTSTDRRTLSTLLHLRLHHNGSYAFLAKAIEEEDQSSLKSLYLTVPRQASRFGGSQREQDRINLLAICATRKIEVVYEEQPNQPRRDSYLSSEFWRRQRELKGWKGAQ